MTKRIVVALAVGLAFAGCKSKKAKPEEPPAAGSGTAAASGVTPAPTPAPEPGSGSAAEPGSGSAADAGSGSGSGGHIVSAGAVTACVRYAACRAEKDPDQSGVAGYQEECTKSWGAISGAERTKLDTCVKTTKGCAAQLGCFANLPVDD